MKLFFPAICKISYHNNEGFEFFVFYEIIRKMRIIEQMLYYIAVSHVFAPPGKLKLHLSFLLTLYVSVSSHIRHFRARLSSLRTSKKLSY